MRFFSKSGFCLSVMIMLVTAVVLMMMTAKITFCTVAQLGYKALVLDENHDRIYTAQKN